MLQNIRDKSTSWISWLIIAAIVIVFALFGVSRYLGAGRADNTVATVNGQPISNMAVSNLYYQLQAEARAKGFYQSTQTFARLLKAQALNTLIHRSALLQAAHQHSMVVSPLVIQAAIQSNPAFQENGRFSPEKWQSFENNNPNAARYVQEVGQDQLLNQVSSGFVTSGFVTHAAWERLSGYLHQARRLAYITIPLSRFKVSSNQVSDANLKDYYNKHKAQFATPEQVQLSYIILSLKKIMDGIKPSAADLQSYYDSNSTQYVKPATWQVKMTTVAMLAKGDKATLAAANSLRSSWLKGTAPDHLKTDTLSAKQLGPALLSSLSALSKPGAISNPVKTEKGYVLYQLVAKTPAKQLPLSAVKNKVAQAYKQQEAEQQFDSDSDQLANLTFSQSDSLIPAAKALGLTVKTTGYLSKSGAHKGIASNPNVLQTAFSSDVLNNHNNSAVINLNNTTQIVIRVKHHKPAGTKPFELVKQSIKTLLIAQAEIHQAKQLSDTLAKAIAKGKSLDDIASHYSVDVKELGFVTQQSKQHTNIVAAGFQMPRSEKTTLLPGSNAYTLVVLQSVKQGKAGKQAQADKLKKQLALSNGQLSYHFYTDSVLKKSVVKHMGNV